MNLTQRVLSVLSLLVATQALAVSPPIRDDNHQFQRPVASWWEIKKQNIVMQQRDYSCGAAALATVVRYYWGDDATEDYFIDELVKMLSEEEMQERVQNGLSMTDLRRLAVRTGYLSTIGQLRFTQLADSKIPLIVGINWEGVDHFAVFRGTDGRWVYLADPGRGNVRHPTWEFQQIWQKNMVLVVAKQNTKPPEYSPLLLRHYETHLGAMNRQVIRSRGSRQ